MNRSVGKGSTQWSSAPRCERRLGDDDVRARGERAVEKADIVLGEQRVGVLADLRFGRLLGRLVEFAAPEQMAGDRPRRCAD